MLSWLAGLLAGSQHIFTAVHHLKVGAVVQESTSYGALLILQLVPIAQYSDPIQYSVCTSGSSVGHCEHCKRYLPLWQPHETRLIRQARALAMTSKDRAKYVMQVSSSQGLAEDSLQLLR